MDAPPTTITRPGSSLHRLTEEAVSIIDSPKNVFEPENIHVYFLAGLTDITEKITDQNYQEVIFIDSPVDANHKMEMKYYDSSNKIKQLGSHPCYCTIAPMHLDKWNSHRLSKHKTSHLQHFRQYADMQELLIQTIVTANQFITSLNIANDMFTPRIASDILYKSGANRAHHRCKYQKLPVV